MAKLKRGGRVPWGMATLPGPIPGTETYGLPHMDVKRVPPVPPDAKQTAARTVGLEFQRDFGSDRTIYVLHFTRPLFPGEKPKMRGKEEEVPETSGIEAEDLATARRLVELGRAAVWDYTTRRWIIVSWTPFVVPEPSLVPGTVYEIKSGLGETAWEAVRADLSPKGWKWNGFVPITGEGETRHIDGVLEGEVLRTVRTPAEEKARVHQLDVDRSLQFAQEAAEERGVPVEQVLEEQRRTRIEEERSMVAAREEQRRAASKEVTQMGGYARIPQVNLENINRFARLKKQVAERNAAALAAMPEPKEPQRLKLHGLYRITWLDGRRPTTDTFWVNLVEKRQLSDGSVQWGYTILPSPPAPGYYGLSFTDKGNFTAELLQENAPAPSGPPVKRLPAAQSPLEEAPAPQEAIEVGGVEVPPPGPNDPVLPSRQSIYDADEDDREGLLEQRRSALWAWIVQQVLPKAREQRLVPTRKEDQAKIEKLLVDALEPFPEEYDLEPDIRADVVSQLVKERGMAKEAAAAKAARAAAPPAPKKALTVVPAKPFTFEVEGAPPPSPPPLALGHQVRVVDSTAAGPIVEVHPDGTYTVELPGGVRYRYTAEDLEPA